MSAIEVKSRWKECNLNHMLVTFLISQGLIQKFLEEVLNFFVRSDNFMEDLRYFSQKNSSNLKNFYYWGLTPKTPSGYAPIYIRWTIFNKSLLPLYFIMLRKFKNLREKFFSSLHQKEPSVYSSWLSIKNVKQFHSCVWESQLKISFVFNQHKANIEREYMSIIQWFLTICKKVRWCKSF